MSTSFPPPPPGSGEQPPSEGSVLPPPPHDPYAAPPPQGYPSAPQSYPAQGGYDAMPSQGPAGPAGTVVRPPAMDKAVLLMKAGAGLSLLGLLLTLVSKSAIRDGVAKASAKRSTPLTPDQIDTSVAVGFAVGIFFGLVGIALWWWMAWANGRGRSWARIVATVFFGLSVLSFLASFAQAGTVLTKALGFVSFLVGAAAIFFIYRKESSDFYKASSAPRR